jgi:hypothetical protein
VAFWSVSVKRNADYELVVCTVGVAGGEYGENGFTGGILSVCFVLVLQRFSFPCVFWISGGESWLVLLVVVAEVFLFLPFGGVVVAAKQAFTSVDNLSVSCW